jgi:Holliday junction resolvasome RuvABC endonuclease subunit
MTIEPKLARVLTLDISTKCGWAFRDERGNVQSGVVKFDREKGLAPLRYTDFGLWLRNRITMLSPEVIVYELPHFRGYDSTLMLCGLVSRAEELACLKAIQFIGCHSGTLKKEVAGRGGASKDEVAAALKVDYPDWIPESDDESDARALLKIWDLLNDSTSQLSVMRGRVKRAKGAKKK